MNELTPINAFQLKSKVIFSFVGAAIILIALLVIAGWIFNIQSLTSVLPAYPPMKFNTALAFVLSGAATMLVYRADKKPAMYFYCLFSGAIFMTGFLTLFQYISGANIGIDNLLIADHYQVSAVHLYPGRMAGATALSFCILGLALMGIRSPAANIRLIAQYALHFVSLTGYIALTGYLFHLTAIYVLSSFVSMALHTSVLLVVLSVTLSFYNADIGIPGLFSGKGIGSQMARKVFPVLVVITISLGYIRFRLFQYHLATPEFALAIGLSVLLIVILAVVWRAALQLNRLEEEKRRTDEVNFKLSLDIATAEKAKNKIDEINNRNLLFVQQAPSPIAMFDTNMRYIAFSEQWVKDYKLEGKQILGLSHYEVFPEIGEDWKSIHRQCLQGAVNKCEEYYFIRADGSGQWISWDVRPWYNADNKVGGLLMYTADISHLKRNEERLKETTERLAEAQQIAHVGSWEWDVVTREIKWSDEHFRIFGFEPAGVPPTVEMYNNRIHPDDRERVINSVSSALVASETYAVEFRLMLPDGSVRYVENRGKIFRNEEGKPVRMTGTGADITDRKKKEAIIQETSESLADAQQIAHVGSWEWDIITGVRKWSAEQYRMLGLEPQSGDPGPELFSNMVHPDDRQRVKAAIEQALNGVKNYVVEFRVIRSDGSLRDVEAKGKIFRDGNGTPVRMVGTCADITDRKNKEAIIHETTERLADAQQIAHVGSWDWDIEAGRITWSDEQYRIYGFEPGAADPNSGLFYSMIHPDDKQRVISVIGNSLTYAMPYIAEFRLVRTDGSVRDVEGRGKVVTDMNGKPVRLTGTLSDITERKKLEHGLMISEKEFRSSFENSAIGMALTSPAGKFMKVNIELCRMLGYTENEMLQLHFQDITHPDSLNQNVESLPLLATKAIDKYQTEKKYIHKTGSTVWVYLTVSMVFDEKQQPLYMVSQMTDITVRKKLERDLMLSEKEFRSSFENSAMGMALVTPTGKYIKVNDELCRITGYTREELLQMGFQDITAPEMLEDNVLTMKRLSTGKIEHYQAEKRYIHKNGSMVWIYLTVSMIFDEKHAAQYMVSQMTDITERKRIEEELKRVNRELFSIFNTETHVAIIAADTTGLITHFSRGAEILLGYSAEEVVGHFTPFRFHDPAVLEARRKELSKELNREVSGIEIFTSFSGHHDFDSREWTYVHKSGRKFPVQLALAPIKDELGNIKGYLGVSTDISESKEAEEVRKNNAVLHSRNKEMEEFAYIASHDLQEPLRTVSSFITILNAEYGQQLQGDAQQYMQFIMASTSRMRELIKGLLEFSRLGKQKSVEQIDCNQLLKEVVDDLGVAIKESGAVITIDELPVIKAFPTEMQQLFQNLLSNAIKFRKPGVQPHIHLSAKPLQGFWQFSVTDNGVGIEPRHFHKIFILFQRLHSRRDYAGTGIGLSYCKKIVELHHGRIWVESVPGEGSTFFFTISNHNL